MFKIELTPEEEQSLTGLHKKQKKRSKADRIKTILLLNKGFSNQQIASILLLDADSVTNYKKRYLGRKDETSWFEDSYKPKFGKLSCSWISRVRSYTDVFKVSDKSEIGEFIKHSFGVGYTKSGLQRLLKRTGLSHKQLHRLPGKMDAFSQQGFVDRYTENASKLSEKEAIMFIDAAHPLHNTVCSKIWGKVGVPRYINSNTGRRRININGAYNPFNQDFIYRKDEKINAASTIGLLKKISGHYKGYKTVYVYADNARPNKNKELAQWLSSQDLIKMRYLPPYSPNLNFIERFWKFMRKNVINTKYYPKFEDFESAIDDFLSNAGKFKEKIAKFIGLKFQFFQT